MNTNKKKQQLIHSADPKVAEGRGGLSPPGARPPGTPPGVPARHPPRGPAAWHPPGGVLPGTPPSGPLPGTPPGPGRPAPPPGAPARHPLNWVQNRPPESDLKPDSKLLLQIRPRTRFKIVPTTPNPTQNCP